MRLICTRGCVKREGCVEVEETYKKEAKSESLDIADANDRNLPHTGPIHTYDGAYVGQTGLAGNYNTVGSVPDFQSYLRDLFFFFFGHICKIIR